MAKQLISVLVILFMFAFMGNAQSLDVEQRIDLLMSKMTLRQKIGQMHQVNGRKVDERFLHEIRKGNVGSILNVEDAALVNKLQRIAFEESPCGIPLLIARDVIHGYKTIYPIPLAQAATFNPEVASMGARVAAVEATEKGIRWTFAPMMDIARDARWGRIAESFGEDPYLAEVMAVAMVKGFQGDNLADASSMASCAKHFVGYGAAEGGRDYNSTFIPDRLLRNLYLPPFEAALKAGCASVMTSFNDNDGIPASGNDYILKRILRDEWNFDGVVVSDWASVKEMVVHGFCADNKEAAMKAANAGLDMEMVSGCYLSNLEGLVAEGKVPEAAIDQAVRNILRMKLRLGLFENPYINLDAPSKAYVAEHLTAAQVAAEQSFVLLKNNNETLPLGNDIKTLALIGPLADAPHDQMGTWTFDGEKAMTQTPLAALRKMVGNQVKIIYEQGLAYSRDTDKKSFSKALAAAKKADVVVVVIGEEAILSGEAHCLAELNLQGAQTELLREIAKAKKPLVTVVMAGRPLTIAAEVAWSDAVLYAWHPGTMGGPALVDILFGKAVPSGKLPVTFPKYVGQIPFYYNHNKTGRPAMRNETLLADIPLEAKQSSLGCTSFYLDAGFDPLFHFGYGLSYTTFGYSNLTLSRNRVAVSDTVRVSVDLSNTGKYDATEVVQLYVRDEVGSVTRPVKELKAFRRVPVREGQTLKVSFDLPVSCLAFYGIDMQKKVEPGKFTLMVGGDSQQLLPIDFWVE